MQFQSACKGIRFLFSQAQAFWNGKEASTQTIKTVLYRFLMLLINFSTSILTARVLGAEGRGELVAIGVGSGLLSNLLTLGMSSSLIYNVKRFPEQKGKFYSVALLISVVMGTLAAVISSAVLIPIWLHQYSSDVIHFAQWLTLGSPLSIIQFSTYGALEAIEAFSLVNLITLLGFISTLLFLLILYFSHNLNPFTASFTYAFAQAPLIIWIVIYTCSVYYPSWEKLGFAFKKLTSYGFKAYGIDLLSILYQQSDQFFVVGLLSPQMVGMYAIAVSLARTLGIFNVSVVMILFPKIAAKSLEEVIHVAGRTTRLTILTMLISSLFLVIFGPILLTSIYGSEYQTAVAVFRLLVFEAALSGTSLVLAQAFMALGRPGIVTLLQAIGLGLSIPLMLFWVPRLGLLGTGVALLTSAIVRLGFILCCFPFVLKIAPPNLLITSEDLRYIYNKF